MNGKVCLNCNTLVQYPDFTTEIDIQCPCCGFCVVGFGITDEEATRVQNEVMNTMEEKGLN